MEGPGVAVGVVFARVLSLEVSVGGLRSLSVDHSAAALLALIAVPELRETTPVEWGGRS